MKRIGAPAMLALALGGCAMLQNLTADDIRKPEYLRESRSFDKTIRQINSAMTTYAQKCRPSASMLIDPTDSTKASMTVAMPGLTDASVVLVVDFKQIGNKTQADGYTYMYTWKSHVEDIFKIIDAPTVCL